MAWSHPVLDSTSIQQYMPSWSATNGPAKQLKIADLLCPVEQTNSGAISVTESLPRDGSHQSRPRRTYLQRTPQGSRQPTTHQWEAFVQSQAQTIVSPSSSRSAYHGCEFQARSDPEEDRSSQASMEQRSEAGSFALSPLLRGPSPSQGTMPALPFDYELRLRQQPTASRACGHGDRDRRVIDPPPILELNIKHKDGSPSQDFNGTFVLNCTLIDAQTGQEPVGELDARRMTSCLMGTSVMNPIEAKDEYGRAGRFFVFSDLSCRLTGRFRLRFSLLRIDVHNLRPGAVHGMVASTDSDVFTSYTAKDFPGMQPSTPLLRALRRHGLNVGLKKGSEARKLRGRARSRSAESNSRSEKIADAQLCGSYAHTDAAIIKVRSNKKPRHEGYPRFGV